MSTIKWDDVVLDDENVIPMTMRKNAAENHIASGGTIDAFDEDDFKSARKCPLSRFGTMKKKPDHSYPHENFLWMKRNNDDSHVIDVD